MLLVLMQTMVTNVALGTMDWAGSLEMCTLFILGPQILRGNTKCGPPVKDIHLTSAVNCNIVKFLRYLKCLFSYY